MGFAHAEEIAKAAEKTGCGRIDADAQALKKKYKGNRKVAEAIEQAENLAM